MPGLHRAGPLTAHLITRPHVDARGKRGSIDVVETRGSRLLGFRRRLDCHYCVRVVVELLRCLVERGREAAHRPLSDGDHLLGAHNDVVKGPVLRDVGDLSLKPRLEVHLFNYNSDLILPLIV